MSESMAFIGGVAVAGLAALLLLKGTNNPLQSNFAVTPQMPGVVAPQAMPQVQYPPYGQLPYSNPQPPATNAAPNVELERLKMDFERLKNDYEQVKAQNQQFQFQFQNWNNAQQQMQFAQQNTQRVAPNPLPAQNSWWSSPIVWAAGGATLTIGGGVVVAGVLSLFSSRPRPTRTVQVIHPYQGSPQSLVPVRRTEFLPPGMETRRVEAHEYDEMH